ncbi:hypothetical protein RJT34_30463 [Clitoria ternatea]|uniref:Uncharacterized protein n=1 Tax=Clitoria ternatea TaxID=43366 RepID=A0AAN9I202_CLITE
MGLFLGVVGGADDNGVVCNRDDTREGRRVVESSVDETTELRCCWEGRHCMLRPAYAVFTNYLHKHKLYHHEEEAQVQGNVRADDDNSVWKKALRITTGLYKWESQCNMQCRPSQQHHSCRLIHRRLHHVSSFACVFPAADNSIVVSTSYYSQKQPHSWNIL